MVETGGKSNLSWCALWPALEPPKKSSLLTLSTTSDFLISISNVNKACLAHLISCQLRIKHNLDSCVQVFFLRRRNLTVGVLVKNIREKSACKTDPLKPVLI